VGDFRAKRLNCALCRASAPIPRPRSQPSPSAVTRPLSTAILRGRRRPVLNGGLLGQSAPIRVRLATAGFAAGPAAALYELYQSRLKALNAVDFGDLLLESLRLFREHGDILASFQRRFRYITGSGWRAVACRDSSG